MLGFIHPRPFPRKEVAVQVAQQESRAPCATELTVERPEQPDVAPVPADMPIRFSVVYGLGEYLSILRDHLAFMARRDKPGVRWRPMAAVWVVLLGTPVFYMKKRRMPVCEFCIDASGIERRTRQGHVRRRWDEVQAVRRYRRGYLLMFEKSGMPIPFRCLTPAQQERLRALFASRVARA